MKLSTKEFNNLNMINNLVLLRAVVDTGYIMLGNTKLDLRSGSTDNSAVVIFEVIKVPQKIVKLPPDMKHSIEWNTDMELKVGDKVWINRVISQNCEKIYCEGEEYFAVPYQFIYLTLRKWNPEDDRCQIIIDPNALPESLDTKSIIRTFEQTGMLVYRIMRQPAIVVKNTRHKEVFLPDNVYREDKKVGKYMQTTFFKVVMLNGFILFKNIPIKEKRAITALNPEFYDWVGRVAFTGSLNKSYRYSNWPDANYINPGDVIHLRHKHRIALEYSLHAEFLDKGHYYITQRNQVLGKITFRDI